MTPGQVQVDGGVIELGVSKKYLDGAKVGASFKQMCGEAMSTIYHAT